MVLEHPGGEQFIDLNLHLTPRTGLYLIRTADQLIISHQGLSFVDRIAEVFLKVEQPLFLFFDQGYSRTQPPLLQISEVSETLKL